MLGCRRTSLVLEDKPGAQVRRRAFITGQVSSRHLATFSSSRSAALRTGTCTLHPIRCKASGSGHRRDGPFERRTRALDLPQPLRKIR